ncbi:TolB family protein [Desulforamulus aeronauticus]|uniref:TolB protein n=1 Tax=Desulforamulus aeronauticus DSM 10349 TaxID=1121421 RepID=A0A1M6RYU4_9FIRM|nr:PD40 domain-containing protein [Desulforamulus aeronauticus]SHK37621.1 TolB protein [Desulforamulus aeronauticus DSM 10349]
MKRLFVLTMALFLAVGFIGCSGQKEKKEDNGVKVIPKPPKQELSVVSIDKLHDGLAQDISPDGKTLLFSWNMGQPDKDPNDEMAPANLLHTMNLADGSVKKLSNSEIHQGSARYSPDGKNIAFLENVETFFQAYVMENKLDAPKKLIHKSDEIANSIAWSPDGQTFAVSYFLINKGRIVLYDAQGNEKQSFQQQSGIAIFPQFLDNNTLLYVSVNRGDNTLKVMALDVTAGTNKPKEFVAGTNFKVSPDKRSLAYLVNDGDRSQWKIKVNAIDSNLKVGSTLTEASVKDSSVQMAWSPDSRYLLFSDESNIWAINTKNGEKKQLVSDMRMINHLLWAGDEGIIFTAISKEDEKKGNYNFNTYLIKLK